ncbi:histidine phosphatase family protein [Arthrobacter sp. MMS18-M83]|uniref:histidine phosphatase family protein n=1 Tax=Arthrobacter sp. MMS18-M83 TaxID=2996261 RepID=UPI00227B5963|nr:histidine phosphatase family protein [Arthrobacter sp. MMS18-M83]WAH97713.1 histidine phosphatase family protein [Arthrobacter sp. MMS18-M83]
MSHMQGSPSLRRLVLWRHGQTDWNAQDRAQGHADITLNETGRQQAREAAPLLASYAPAFVWSSDLARACHTAMELVALTGSPLVLDRRLREYNVGIRQGKTLEEFRNEHPDLHQLFFAGDDFRMPGAELPSEVSARMGSVMRDAVDALGEGETGVLVGHGASLASGLLAFFDAPAHMREMFAGMANCAWTVLAESPERGWQIVDFNAQTLTNFSALSADRPSG